MPEIPADARLTALKLWLQPLAAEFSLAPQTLAPASADASFRRYFRVASAVADRPNLIIMDAPPAREDCRPFVQIARLLGETGVSVPEVLAADLEQGFLLLSDLGTRTYLSELAPNSASRLYQDACAALIRIQTSGNATSLPVYDRALLTHELQLFPDWYVGRHCRHVLTEHQRGRLDSVFGALVTNNLAQPRVLVHRDYHSRNLMVLEAGEHAGNPGILDFQDAVSGPITYDLVSLLRDAYIQWDEEQVLDWAIRYWQQAQKAGLPVDADFGEFWRDFEWMGLQRHLKVLGIFARLYHRDGKDGYLKDLPLVLHYTRRTAERYTAFKPLVRLLDVLEARTDRDGFTF